MLLANAAAARDARRRVALVERLAELEIQTDAIAKAAIHLVTDGLPAVVEATKLALATTAAADRDAVVLERLVRADPQTARRVLDSMADPVTETGAASDQLD